MPARSLRGLSHPDTPAHITQMSDFLGDFVSELPCGQLVSYGRRGSLPCGPIDRASAGKPLRTRAWGAR